MKDYTKFPLLLCNGNCLDVAGDRVAITLNGANKDYLANARRIQATWNACLGLDIPADVPPGILKDLVTAATNLCQSRHTTDYGRTGAAFKTIDGLLAKLAPAGSQDNRIPVSVKRSPFVDQSEDVAGIWESPVSPPDTTKPVELVLPARYYAIVAADRSGPAYGVGESPDEAWKHTAVSGTPFPNAGETQTVAVEITPMSYAAVKAGNPDAWLAVADVPYRYFRSIAHGCQWRVTGNLVETRVHPDADWRKSSFDNRADFLKNFATDADVEETDSEGNPFTTLSSLT